MSSGRASPGVSSSTTGWIPRASVRASTGVIVVDDEAVQGLDPVSNGSRVIVFDDQADDGLVRHEHRPARRQAVVVDDQADDDDKADDGLVRVSPGRASPGGIVIDDEADDGLVRMSRRPRIAGRDRRRRGGGRRAGSCERRPAGRRTGSSSTARLANGLGRVSVGPRVAGRDRGRRRGR
ncbi:MAG: hypothetical protein KF878_06935 [Planctomycetes bacterium]|nr:hypothetical protein [Planctomycetota bacterium]